MSATIIGVVFGTVLLAELVGDKLLYGMSALVARFGARTVMAGALPAIALKMLAAVVFGGTIARLPRPALAAVSCLAFAVAAWTIWHAPSRSATAARGRTLPAQRFSVRGAAAAFAAIFLAEWADPGQVATASMAVYYAAPMAVWTGAFLALSTKAVVALMLGSVVQRYAPERAVRLVGAGLGVVLAVSAFFVE